MRGSSTNGVATASVLIVEDHALVREGLADLLARGVGFEICGSVGSADEALVIARARAPDFALVDLRLSNGDTGLALIRQLRSRGAGTKVVVVSGQDPGTYREAALRAGAVAFIPKQEVPTRLLSTLRSLLG